ncbi:MAG: hypothetical protein AAF703_03495 [Cyanobacteria bacterium P01_D01_bin.105]
MTMNEQSQPSFAICIANEGCDDLQILKVYQLLPDKQAAEENYVRVVDDSGEDYLYPANRFVKTQFFEAVRKQLQAAMSSAA